MKTIVVSDALYERLMKIGEPIDATKPAGGVVGALVGWYEKVSSSEYAGEVEKNVERGGDGIGPTPAPWDPGGFSGKSTSPGIVAATGMGMTGAMGFSALGRPASTVEEASMLPGLAVGTLVMQLFTNAWNDSDEG